MQGDGPVARLAVNSSAGFVCVLGIFASGANGQIAGLEGKRIVDIQFQSAQPLDAANLAIAQRQPAQPLDAADLARVLPLHKDEPLRAEDVANAIDGLFATGQFQDIAVEAEPSADGVIVRFVVQNTLFVGGVSVEGKVGAPPNRSEIAAAAQLTLGAPFRDQDLTRASETIKDLLTANGLYEASVAPEVRRSENAEQVFITFRLKEQKRAKYEVPVIHGDAKLADGTIIRATGWRIPLIHWWRQVTDARTRNGVQGVLRKYAKQDRLSAQVEVEKLDYDAARRRVRPSLKIDPGPEIKIKSVETKISRGKLKRYVPVYQEGAVDNDLLVEGKRNLIGYFQSQGYYDVDVDFRIQPLKDDVETIEYAISRGQRQKLTHIAIVGNRYFSMDDIRERMFMAPASFLVLRHGRYSEAFQRKDEETIAALYRANGFRDVKVVSTVEREYNGKAGQIAVTVNISEGPQWLVETLTVEGVAQADRDELLKNLASSTGEPFSELNLANDRDSVLTYYYAHGFPSADFKAAWAPSGAPNRVKVVYTVTEGERQYVREVLTSGLRHTRLSLVNSKITLQPGDPLSPLEQINIQKRFYDLGVFATVNTAIENPDGATTHKYVLYNFEEANRYTLTLGVGAQLGRFGSPSSNSLAAPAGSTGFSPAFSLDVSRLNFLGIGHTITWAGLYSNIEQRASLSYVIPHFLDDPRRTATYSVLWDKSLNVNTFASRREEASVQLSQKFSKSLTGLFRFSYRRVSVSDVVIPVLLIPQLLQSVRLGMLSGNIVHDRRDNPADPHRGMYISADVGLAGRFFGSQRSFGRILLRNATYYRLTKNLVLARQTQLGAIFPFSAPAGISAQESVPLPERFFGGGADSLRAFPFNQAGPRDTGAPLTPGGPASAPTGFPLGGNALLFNNVELRFPFIGENIHGVLFHDVGNVYSSLGNLSLRFKQRNLQNFDYAVHAVGFGVRYKTPVGPIRLDLAYSINPPSFVGFSGTPLQLLQCGVTGASCTPTQQTTSHFQFFFSIGQTF
ncbi:MAG TPA: BamA/TamA family outer membrane protein [Bryobacteraceae bacterium]|nr:BamA/TamA family outer membrane protein [Bryobacteraceae bacterium]